MGCGARDSLSSGEGLCLPWSVRSLRNCVSFGTGDLSLARCVTVVGDDGRLHRWSSRPGEWFRTCSCPYQPHQGPIYCFLCGALQGFPVASVQDGFRLLWVGPGGNGQQVWPQRRLWDWPWTLVPFMPLPRHIDSRSSGLLEAGSQNSSRGPGREEPQAQGFPSRTRLGPESAPQNSFSSNCVAGAGVGVPTLVM